MWDPMWWPRRWRNGKKTVNFTNGRFVMPKDDPIGMCSFFHSDPLMSSVTCSTDAASSGRFFIYCTLIGWLKAAIRFRCCCRDQHGTILRQLSGSRAWKLYGVFGCTVDSMRCRLGALFGCVWLRHSFLLSGVHTFGQSVMQADCHT